MSLVVHEFGVSLLGLRFFRGHAIDLFVDGAELQDFQGALAIGRVHDGFVSDLLVKERATDGAGSRNFPSGDVRFFAGDELVFDLFFFGAVVDLDGRAESHAVVGNVVHIDHGQVGEPLAELADARLDELLALLGHVVFGVFAEVAERGGLLDLFGQFVDQLVFERVDLFLQFLFDEFCHGLLMAGLRQGLRHYTLGKRLAAVGAEGERSVVASVACGLHPPATAFGRVEWFSFFRS